MANRSRSRAAAATGDKPAAKPATRRAAAVTPPPAPAPAQGTDDEQDLEGDDEDQGDDRPGIRVTSEDFRNNRNVIDMAAEVEGQPGEDFADRADAADDDEDEDEPEAPARRSSSKAAAPRRRSVRVRIRLVGVRDAKGRVSKRSAKTPYGVTLVVPSADAEDQDAGYDGIHTEGETVQFTRGRSVTVSARAAEWLMGHPVYAIEEA